MEPKKNSAPSAPGDYVLGFSAEMSFTDVKACFRASVARVRQIYADRLTGLGCVKDEAARLADQKLLDGDLEISVAPEHTIYMEAKPLVTFRPERLILDDEAADWYVVSDVKVGRNSQFISCDPLPGSSFKASVSPVMRMDTAQPSLRLTVSLVNVSDRPRRPPRVMMTGKAVV